MKIAELARTIRTREDLVGFLQAFRADYEASETTWTNDDLSSFLDAMAAWSSDMEGFYANAGDDLVLVPPWRVLADILMAARTYE